MKKIITTIIAFCAIVSTNAQLKVLSSGQTVIDRDTCIQGATVTIGQAIYNSYPNYQFGLFSHAYNKDKWYNIGVSGKAEDNTSFTNIGIQGLAAGANANNFGILGGLSSSSSNGAGIFGTVTQHLGYDLVGKYAGFFDGNTYVNGTLTASSLITPSDMRLKENVAKLSEEEQHGGSTLESLMGLNVIHYNYAPRVVEERGDTATQGTPRAMEATENTKPANRHYGLSAQQLREIYPDLVYEGQDGYLGINYVELVPLLLRSIQELKAEVEELRAAGDLRTGDARNNSIAGGQTEEKTTENQRLMLLK